DQALRQREIDKPEHASSSAARKTESAGRKPLVGPTSILLVSLRQLRQQCEHAPRRDFIAVHKIPLDREAPYRFIENLNRNGAKSVGTAQENPGLIPVPHNRDGGNGPAGVGGLRSRMLDDNAGTDRKSGAQTPASRSDLGDGDR